MPGKEALAFTARTALTVETLQQATEGVEGAPRWLRTVQDAEEVVVRATPYVELGTIFALDQGASWRIFRNPLLVLCHPDDELAVGVLVQSIRVSARVSKARGFIDTFFKESRPT
jgi:hypothetical protein